MTPQQFEMHKDGNPHLEFTKSKSKLIPIEKTYNDEFGFFNIFRRDFYTKSNGKICYVDAFVKEVKVEKNKTTGCKNGYSRRIKNQFIKDYI